MNRPTGWIRPENNSLCPCSARFFPDSAKLVITHDISVASACDRILVLCKGRMLETGTACDVLSKPRHPYTKALLNALVENGMQETPFLRKESGACPFYRRCPLALEQCRNEIRLKKQRIGNGGAAQNDFYSKGV